MDTTTGTETTTDTDTLPNIDTTIERYLEVWNEVDEANRTELARALWTDDGYLVDPLIEARGGDAISAAIGGLQEQMPGHSMSRTTVVDAHHDHARFGWAVSGPDGSVAIAGVDVVTFAPDGRLKSAIAFFGDTVRP